MTEPTMTRRDVLVAAAAGTAAALAGPRLAWANAPSPADTVHLVGDLHFGALSWARRDQITADVTSAAVPRVLHLQLGDATEHATTAQDTEYFDWRNRIGGSWRGVLGNHDLFSGRSFRNWEKRYGQKRNDVLDVGFARIVHVGPDLLQADNTSIVLTQKTLNWLDQQLASLAPPVLVSCHAPLFDTVTGPTSGPDAQYSSLEPPFYAQPASAIEDILDRRRSAKAWLSGHTHSDVSAPGLVMTKPLRTRSIVAINGSALLATGRTRESTDPLRSLYVSVLSDRFEVRVRDHAAQAWGTIGDQLVTAVPIPA